jgi:rhodanese-related sulfurtransferase
MQPSVSAQAPPAGIEIDRDELAHRQRAGSIVVVDALPAESFVEGHIPGALSLPLGEVRERARSVLPDPSAEIAVYCASETCPRAEDAIGQLRALGYTRLRHYREGLAGWMAGGGRLERGPASPQIAPGAAATRGSGAAPAPGTASQAGVTPLRRARERLRVHRAHHEQWGARLVEWIDSQGTQRLFLTWLSIVAACGLVYWAGGLTGVHVLVSSGEPVDVGFSGLGTALYFSFVTATSVGFGDVAPVGFARVLAVAEAITGLLIFGAVVSKFVSRRQDEVMREIHRITFEERLDRVQRSLHLVLSELQALADLCTNGAPLPPRLPARLESTALVFSSELRATHDLLYRPRSAPEEAALASILASLAASLRELHELLGCLPVGFTRTPNLDDTLRTIVRLANDICGECVPHTYAPGLRAWMDRIQATAREIA